MQASYDQEPKKLCGGFWLVASGEGGPHHLAGANEEQHMDEPGHRQPPQDTH